jgi:hypothetical protein
MKIREYNELHGMKKEKVSFSDVSILIGFLLFVPLFTVLFSMVKDLFAIIGVLLGVVTSIWLDVHFNKGNKLVRTRGKK